MKRWRNTPEATLSQPGMESQSQRGASLSVTARINKYSGWIRSKKALLFLMSLLVGLIALVPLYGVLFPPLVDLPEHILLSKLLWEKLSGVSHLDLEISWYLGYRLFTALTLILIHFFKLGGISLVYFPMTVAMMLMSLHAIVVVAALCAGLKTSSWKGWALAVCFSIPAVICMYSACWFIGFATYILGITALIPAIFLTERFLRSGKLVDASLLFLALVVVYIAHPFAPAFWLLWCFSRTLAAFATQTIFLEWKRLFGLGLIFLPIALYHLRATRATVMAPSSHSLLNHPPVVPINDWYKHRYRDLLDGVYLQADDAADSRFFARFAIGFILVAAVLAFRVAQHKGIKNAILSSILLMFVSSLINEKLIPIPPGAWLAYDYRFASTVYAVGLAMAGMVLIRLMPVARDKLQYKLIFVFVGIVSAIACAGHLKEVRKAYTRFDGQARQFMAKVFNHEEPTGIYLPHSRWHPNDSRIKLYVCLQEPDCNPPGTSFITGYMGDLYPVKLRSNARVMSAREQAVWSKKQPAGPLVGYWKLDEPNRTDACIDSSGNGHTGTAYGTSVVDGKIDRARSFNGNGDYIDIPAINISHAITVAAWIYSDNFLQNTFIIAKNPINTQWALLIGDKGSLKWRGAGVETNVACDIPSNGAWHHIVARQEGTTGSLYVDGVLRASGTLPGIGNGAGSISLGRFNSGDHWYFTGKIDDVRVYNRALSASEISELFTTSSTSRSSPSPGGQLKSDAVGGNASSKL